MCIYLYIPIYISIYTRYGDAIGSAGVRTRPGDHICIYIYIYIAAAVEGMVTQLEALGFGRGRVIIFISMYICIK